MSDDGGGGVTRRDLLKSALVTSVSAAAGPAAARAGAELPDRRPSLIPDENARSGAPDWQLTRARLERAGGVRSPWIEGYCSKQSVAAGESIRFMVSTNPKREFVIEIFRTGYYAGRGARLMTTLGPIQGKTQTLPVIGRRRIRECRWGPAAELTIPEDWPSGVYLGRLTLLDSEPAWQSYTIFIVRDDRPADLLFQCSDNTWQAYNRWPTDFSLYQHPRGKLGPWADVSFDRPYGLFPKHNPNPQTLGSGEFLSFEFPLSYWLEAQGYDVSYCSNRDLTTPDRARKCKALLSVGHDEYWDIRQYKSALELRNAGVNLLFFSANTCCWVSPFRPSSDGRPDRIISRGGPYGGESRWAIEREAEHGPFPQRGPDEGTLLGARNGFEVMGSGDWTCRNAGHWVYAGTGIQDGDRIPGLMGWEVHADPPGELPGLEILAEGTVYARGVTPTPYAATIYPSSADSFVFNSSTIFWAQGLSHPPGHQLPWVHWVRPHGPDVRVERMTRNLLDRVLAAPAAESPTR
jgi:hypothetical protein